MLTPECDFLLIVNQKWAPRPFKVKTTQNQAALNLSVV